MVMAMMVDGHQPPVLSPSKSRVMESLRIRISSMEAVNAAAAWGPQEDLRVGHISQPKLCIFFVVQPGQEKKSPRSTYSRCSELIITSRLRFIWSFDSCIKMLLGIGGADSQ